MGKEGGLEASSIHLSRKWASCDRKQRQIICTRGHRVGVGDCF